MNIIYFGYDMFIDVLKFLINKKDINILKVFSFETDNEIDFNREIISLCNQENIPITLNKVTKNDMEDMFLNKNPISDPTTVAPPTPRAVKKTKYTVTPVL